MALTITKSDVTTYVAPELLAANLTAAQQAILTDAVWTNFITWADAEITADITDGAARNRIGMYLVAHLVTLFLRAAGGQNTGTPKSGPVSGISVGQVSKTFAQVQVWTQGSLAEAKLAETSYGQEFMRLARNALGGSAVVSSGNGALALSSGE